jgi:hypothetical protein
MIRQTGNLIAAGTIITAFASGGCQGTSIICQAGYCTVITGADADTIAASFASGYEQFDATLLQSFNKLPPNSCKHDSSSHSNRGPTIS